MSAADLVSLLPKARRTSRETWVARCPAHEDRSPSLSVRETPDGRVLLHCHAGCEPAAVLAAVGLTFADVMPEQLGNLRPIRAPFPARDVLECVAQEAVIALICARHLAKGQALPAADLARLSTATRRLQEAVDVVR